MFIGHYGAAFAGKKLAPEVSLGWLFLAGNFVDLLWPIFLLLKWERVGIDPGNTVLTPLSFDHYPYTHSLLSVFLWAALVALLYFRRQHKPRASLVLFALVVSHWALDAVTHRPDLPLWPGGAKVGLGLWNSLPGTIIVEMSIFAGGIALYLSATNPRRGRKTWGPWGLVTVLLLVQAVTYFGPPPPNEWSIVLLGLAQWFFVPWAYWVDRRREGKAFRSDALYRLGAETD